MNIEEFRTKLEINGLGHYFDKLQTLSKNAIRLFPKKIGENQQAIGQTRIGGKPDLPKHITWVTETNTIETTEKKLLVFSTKKKETITKPLSFVAQINLYETSQYDEENLLPKTGFLYFFYSAEQEAWGFDQIDKNKFKVIYWNGNMDELVTTDYP